MFRVLWDRQSCSTSDPGRPGWLTSSTEFLTGLGSLSPGLEKLCFLFFVFFPTLMEHKPWQQERCANRNYRTLRNAFCILQQFWGKWRVYFETSLQRWKKKTGEVLPESWSTLWKSCTTLNCWNGSVDLLVHAVACYLWLGRDLEDIDSLVGFCFPSSSLSVRPQSRQWGAEGPASWVGSRWPSVAA